MNYSEMTDLEINKAVALALGCHIRKSAYDTDYYFTDDDKAWNKCAPHGPVENFDPCNSWTDAGPIIQSNRFYVDPIFMSDWCVTTECDTYREIHKNPLRAAMVVFLMTQEVL